MNPKQMQGMLKQLGIQSQELHAQRVIFELEKGRLIIESPQVTVMKMQGQKIYSVVGEERSEDAGVSAEDIELVVEQTGKSHSEAAQALKETEGDIAQAIVKLKGE